MVMGISVAVHYKQRRPCVHKSALDAVACPGTFTFLFFWHLHCSDLSFMTATIKETGSKAPQSTTFKVIEQALTWYFHVSLFLAPSLQRPVLRDSHNYKVDWKQAPTINHIQVDRVGSNLALSQVSFPGTFTAAPALCNL